MVQTFRNFQGPLSALVANSTISFYCYEKLKLFSELESRLIYYNTDKRKTVLKILRLILLCWANIINNYWNSDKNRLRKKPLEHSEVFLPTAMNFIQVSLCACFLSSSFLTFQKLTFYSFQIETRIYQAKLAGCCRLKYQDWKKIHFSFPSLQRRVRRCCCCL